MEKIWLANYPKQVPAEIPADTYGSLAVMIDRVLSEFRDLDAFTFLGKTKTYADIDHDTKALASYFQNALGLKPGDRLAVMMPNCFQTPIAVFAALRAGLTVVNVNPLYTARELKHQLSDSGAKAIVVLENFAHVVEEAKEGTGLEHIVISELGDMVGLKGAVVNFVLRYVKKMVPAHGLSGHRFKHAINGQGEFTPVSLASSDIAFLQYTGGTTGVSKGVMLTHANMLANIAQAKTWVDAGDVKAGSERIVTALPLYHIFALTANCFTFMRLGANNLLIPNARDIPALLKAMSAFKATAFTGVNTLFNGMLNNPAIADVDFSSMRVTLSGGMAAQSDVARRWYETTGCVLLEAYGLTETSPAVCMNPLTEETFNGTVGLPISSTEVCVRDDAGKELAIGEPGELCIRGPQVMAGYWNRPEATAEVIDGEGWFASGDVAVINDQGYVKIVDRIKDMILVSGFNVYPNEVEEQIVDHPGVIEAGVVGEVCEGTGEQVVAVVVRSDPSLSASELEAWCKERMTGYKRPARYVFKDELPKTNVGKILRREIKALI